MFITHTQIHLTIFKNNQTKQVQVPDTKSLTISDFISPPPSPLLYVCVVCVCVCPSRPALLLYSTLFGCKKQKHFWQKFYQCDVWLLWRWTNTQLKQFQKHLISLTDLNLARSIRVALHLFIKIRNKNNNHHPPGGIVITISKHIWLRYLNEGCMSICYNYSIHGA